MERGISRRTFFKLAGSALFLEGCQQAREHTPLGFIFPDTRSQSTAAYHTSLTYTPAEFDSLTVVGFGDSNLNGRFLPDRKSLPQVAADLVSEKRLGNWAVHNLSYVGATTADVLHNQVRRADIVSFMNGVEAFDCWINVGGNDVNSLFDSQEEQERLGSLMGNPVKLELVPFISRLFKAIQEIGPRYSALLEGTLEQYGEKINRFVLIPPSNFANTQEIHIGSSAEDTTKYKLDTWYKRLIVHQSSVLINQEVCSAINGFMNKHADKQVIAVDTFGFDQSCFLNDQHYSREGQRRIAEEVLRRSIVSN